jgi:GTP-dependent dephospho-CoA kinase
MFNRMPLNPDDIHLLKDPFGILIRDKYVTERKIKGILKDATKVISVGDSTTDRLISFDIIPDISVIDGIERRLKRSQSLHSKITTVKELHCSNPAGSISKEAFFVLCQAFSIPGPVKVVVDGEEDMLALPIITIAPEEAVVLYGQPLEGIVVVNVSPEMQTKAKNLMDRVGLK